LGQQLPLDADDYITLPGLSPAGVSLLLLQQQGSAPITLRSEFHALTQGNPRLLRLCLAALAGGETPSDLQLFLATSPAVDLLFSQTLLRLPESEQQVLMSLSVFRSPAPLAYWQKGAVAEAVKTLLAQGFLQSDQAGNLDLPLVYRQLLLRNLDEATSRQLHQQAATWRSQSGAYTAAAYHLVEAGQAEAALALWRDYGAQEIAQGQAATALALFQTVQRLTLPAAAHEQATLICAQLQHLIGQPSQAAATLQSVLVRTPILAVEAAELTGVIANDQSAFDNAATAFARALRVAEELVETRLAHIYKGRAWLHLRQREIAQAEGELALAQVEIENMRGNLAFDRAEYDQAADHYHLALQAAEVVGAPEAVGKCRNNLGGVALFQGNFADAIHHLTQAIAAYECIGKVAAQAGCRITLAVAHNQAGAYQQALAVLAEATDLLTLRSELLPWQQALIAQARAEAYLGLGDWSATETQVQSAIAAEEITILPDAYRVYGEFCLHRGDYQQAESWLRQAVALADANGDGYLAAYAQRKLGVLYQATGQHEAAAQTVAAVLHFFEEANLPHEIERTHRELGTSDLEKVRLSTPEKNKR
jgi:tetratricopeptide (TPR) repeat protein